MVLVPTISNRFLKRLKKHKKNGVICSKQANHFLHQLATNAAEPSNGLALNKPIRITNMKNYRIMAFYKILVLLCAAMMSTHAVANTPVQLYFSTVSPNIEIKKQQQRIEMILSGKNVDYEILDIDSSESFRAQMEELADDPYAEAPQIGNSGEYCGDYYGFEEAMEEESLNEFLFLE
jgi:glutaredoxin-related protein